MVVADVQVPIRHHAIRKHQADSSVTTSYNSHVDHIFWYTYCITAIKQTIFKRGQEVGNPLVSLLLVGSFSHAGNNSCMAEQGLSQWEICNMYSYWLGPCSAIYRKQGLILLSIWSNVIWSLKIHLNSLVMRKKVKKGNVWAWDQ